MVINDFPEDFKKLKVMSKMTDTEIAEKLKMSRPNVSRVMKGGVIPKRFEEIYEAMGYDLKVVYVKRGDK